MRATRELIAVAYVRWLRVSVSVRDATRRKVRLETHQAEVPRSGLKLETRRFSLARMRGACVKLACFRATTEFGTFRRRQFDAACREVHAELTHGRGSPLALRYSALLIGQNAP